MNPKTQIILDIVKNIGEENELGTLYVEFKNVRCGRARHKTRKITIPNWIFNSCDEYIKWYIIHELTHFIALDKHNYTGHRGIFRRIEKKYLKQYGLIPKYNRAYIKELYDLNGKYICNNIGEVKKEKVSDKTCIAWGQT